MIKIGPYDFRLHIKVLAKGRRSEDLCAIIRGIAFVNNQSDGQSKKNSELRNGCIITFGNQPGLVSFIKSLEENLNDESFSLIKMRVVPLE